MWAKLLLLICYLLSLFFISRLLEAAAWYEAGFLSYRILDPFALSVRKLKRLLEQRGVSYAGFVEKQELTNLVQSSGEVTEGELAEASVEEDMTATPSTTTHFTGGTHFYEEVEDTKDSVWVVQVVPPTGSPLLSDLVWRQLQSRVARFGVRTGIFDCSVDRKWCSRKGWHTPQLILALPKGHRAKDSVVLHNYYGRHPVRLQPILDWLQKQLMARVDEVSSVDDLKANWLSYDNENISKFSEVRVLLFSVLLDPPLFLLALGVKFSGRVRFGMVHLKDRDKTKELEEELKVRLASPGGSKLPTYLVVTREHIFVYGRRVGEYLNYHRMELLLRSLRPEANDVFLLSLLLVNLLGGLNFFLVREQRLWRQAVFCLWRLGKANCILFLVWLFLLGLGQFALMDQISEFGLKIVRLASGSNTASVLRNDWQRLRSHPTILIASFAAFSWAGIWLWRMLFGRTPTNAETTANFSPGVAGNTNSTMLSDWWSVSLDSYLMDCFFRPTMATLPPPLTPSDLDLEEGMEMLIERLAVPHFWLQPVISNDYIKDLPCWTHWPPSSNSSSSYSSTSESEDRSDTVNSEDDEGIAAEQKVASRLVCTCQCASSQENVRLADRNSNFANLVSNHGSVENRLPLLCSCNDPGTKNVNKSGGRHSSRKNSRHHHHHKYNSDTDTTNVACTTQPPSGILTCHECAICLDLYKPGTTLCALPCGHNYHQQCIVVWLSRDNHHCPVCRWPAYKSKLRPCHVHLHAE